MAHRLINGAMLSTLVLLVGLPTGCASVCRPPQTITTRPATRHPHVRIVVPLAELQRQLDAELARIGPQPLPLPPALRLVPGIGKLSVAVRSAKILPAEGSGLKIHAGLALQRNGRELTRAQTQIHLRPRLEGKELVLALRPADLEHLRLQLSPTARQDLARELQRVLPGPLRGLVDAKRLLQLLESESYPLLRSTLLARLGELGRVKVKLPDVPVQRATLSSHAKPLPHLRLAIFSSLPVRRGLRAPLRPHASSSKMAISGSALAELGNDGMRRGLLPRRYDSKLRPKADGDHLPRYDWRAGHERPLKLVVTKISTPCARVVLGAKAQLRREGEKLVVGISDARIEHVQGAPLTRFWVWLRQLWKAPINKTRTIVSGLELKLGKRRLAVRVEEIAATSEGVITSFSTTLAP